MRDPIIAQDYRVFGLRVRSEFALPELFPAETIGDPDVTLRTGPVKAPPEDGAGLFAHDGALVLVVPEVARYRIEEGRAITVEPAPGVPERNVRLYLLGSAFGALLHQRGLLPLHANAVEIDGGAVAFMGESGAGKSTLAAWFHDRGYKIIADDVCVVYSAPGGSARIMPGLPRLRLWREALEHTGRDPSDFPRSYAGNDSWNKYDVSIADRTNDREVKLRAIYLLRKGEQFRVDRLQGVAAADAIFANTYRGAFVSTVHGQEKHWTSATRLLRSTPVFMLTRAWGLEHLDEQGARILEVLAESNS